MVITMDFYPDRVRVQPDGCWIWTGAKTGHGYGMVRGPRTKGTSYRSASLTHRLSYQYHVGPIPEGTEIDHLCCVKACVNPNHLEAVTHQVNIQRQHGNFNGPGIGFNFIQSDRELRSIIDQLLDQALPGSPGVR